MRTPTRHLLHHAAGMWDGQDGAASSEAWIYSLDWAGREGFADAKRHIIRARALREERGCCLCDDSRESAAQQAGGGRGSGKLQLGGQGQGRRHGKSDVQQQQQQQQQQRQLQADHHRRRQQQPSNKHDDASGDKVVAYWKRSGRLTHVVLAEAGHMVPRDAPQAGRCMLERWLQEAL
jgi:vitellogenic carboxypeptidase-like protein